MQAAANNHNIPKHSINSSTSNYASHNQQQVFTYPNLNGISLAAMNPSLPIGPFTSPAAIPRGNGMPRWTTPISIIPSSGSGTGASEEETGDYQLVSGFGSLNPEEGMLEGLSLVLLCYQV